MKKLTNEEFVNKATKVHNGKYTYTRSEYDGRHNLVCITCTTHGDFWQSASAHLVGKGCKLCGKANNPAYRPKPIVAVIKDFQAVHGNKYTYIGILDYVNSHTRIKILCNTTGLVFEQTPSNHLSGSGCSCCAISGFDTSAPAILYYLSINDGAAYKIGITNRTVQERFSSTDLSKIVVLSITEYTEGALALKEETKIKKLYKQYRYEGPDILSSGNTELFSIDILGKDKHELH